MTPAWPLVIAATIGCARPSILPPEPEPLPAESSGAAHVGVAVEGVVTDRWGYVVPDAWVTVRVGSPGRDDPECADASHLPTRTRTSPTGRFAVVVDAGPRPAFDACLEVEALPPRGLRLRENRTVVSSAHFAPIDALVAQPVAVRVTLY